jgi:phospholipase C
VLSGFHAETHPSQPNYYVLFSGSTQGVTDDSCLTPGFSSAPDLAAELLAAGRTWASYNEGLPTRGSTVCTAGRYAQKHNPWFGFSNVPADSALPLSALPHDPARLPQVAFVVPDLCHDMHDCPVSTGDTWLRDTLGGYAAWARTHNSLLVLTFDEDDGSADNRIPTVVYGAHVAPGGSTAVRYDHRDLLRTLEDLSGLRSHAGSGHDITGIWN